MEAFPTAPPPFNPYLPVNPPPVQTPGMALQPQFVSPATGLQQSHMGYPSTPPQPQYQQAPATGYPPQQPTGYPPQQPTGYPPQQPTGYPPQQPTGYPPQQPTGYPPQQPTGYPPQQPTGYPPQQPTAYPPQQPTGYPPKQPIGYSPQQPTGYIRQRVNTVAIGTWPTYPMPMDHHRSPPAPPPARPHPSTLPRYSVDYPPSAQLQQPRHSLLIQSTIPPFGAPTTGPAVNPRHSGVPVLPGSQQKQLDAGAIGAWPRTSPTTYSKHMGYYGAAPPTPPARPHPSMLPRHSVDYPPSVEPQQPRHSLQHQSTFPPFEVPMTNQTTHPTHAGVPRLPVAQNYTSVTHVQKRTTLQQQQQQQQPATPSSDPVAPQGYNIGDVFQEGNIIQLIPRGDSAPIKLSGSHIKPHGDFLHPEKTFFRVKIPCPGIVQLSNYNKPKSLVTMDKKGNIRGDGKETGDQSCQFKAILSKSESKRYVCLESMKYPKWYLSMQVDGGKFGPSDGEVKFRVRVEQWVTPRKSVLKAFGRQSIANKLRDGGTIQLKGKNSNIYLRINKRGVVDEVIHGDDRLTYFTLSDRGLGVVSLHSYQHGGHRIRISNCDLEGKGDPDSSADFYLKETRDGAVAFESVTCPGTYLSMRKGADKSTTFAVYHVYIDKHGKRGVQTTLVTP